MVFGQLFEVMAKGAQQGSAAIGVVGLHQTHDLVINDQPIRAIAVPVDASQVDIQRRLGQGLRQQAEQPLAIDRLASRAHGALLGQPNQKAAINQGHAGPAAMLAKTAIRT